MKYQCNDRNKTMISLVGIGAVEMDYDYGDLLIIYHKSGGEIKLCYDVRKFPNSRENDYKFIIENMD